MPKKIHLRSGKIVNFTDTVSDGEVHAAVIKLHLQDQREASSPESSQFNLGQTSIGANDPTQSIVRRAAAYLPTVGNVAGDVAGGSIAGPLGAMAGGGIGAAGGDVLRQMIQNPTRQPEAESAVREGLYGGAASALGAAATAGLPTAFSRKLSGPQASDIAILEREGIPYTAGDIWPGGVAQQTENLMRGTLFGGRIMEGSTAKQAEALSVFREKVLNNIGQLLSKEETGQALQGAIEGRTNQLFNAGGVFDKAYKRAGILFPAEIDASQVRAGIAPIKKKLDALLSEGRIPAAKAGESPARFASLVDNLA